MRKILSFILFAMCHLLMAQEIDTLPEIVPDTSPDSISEEASPVAPVGSTIVFGETGEEDSPPPPLPEGQEQERPIMRYSPDFEFRDGLRIILVHIVLQIAPQIEVRGVEVRGMGGPLMVSVVAD